MPAHRIFALAVAGAVALAPAAALAAPAHHPSHERGIHHHASGRHSSSQVGARRHRLQAKLRAEAARLDTLRKEIHQSNLSHREQTVMLKHVDALRHRLDGLDHHLKKADSTQHLTKLDHDVVKETALVPADRDVVRSLHVTEHGLGAVGDADRRLHHDESRCGEERTGEMYDIDTAIVDLEDAQRLLLAEVRGLLSADPESLSSLQAANHRAAVDSRKAIADLTQAVEALVKVESHF